MSEDNLDLVRRTYESFNRWALDPSLRLRGEDFLHPVRIEVEELVAADDRVVVISRQHAVGEAVGLSR
jgi:hypothetical protein